MKRFAPAVAAALLAAAPAAAQLGDLVSPGPLSAAHAKLEGLRACVKCHEKGNRVSAARCLDCHKDVASRIAAKKGVHRDVKDECASCHAEHAGRDAELRPFETKGFDHAGETGFPLDGRHAPLAARCASCHKTRSFLKLSPSCASCHADPHKGALGAACATCHSTAASFKEARQSFDHGKTRFPLTGAHVRVACAKCHANAVFRGLKFTSCADCHQDPHRKAFGADCSTCHETTTFRTTKVDHARTGFPLRGRHAEIPCAACHKEPARKARLKAGPCEACHQDPHRGEFRQGCASCHTEKGFRDAPFDHAGKTRFPLTGRHATTRCAACHVPPGGAAAANGRTPKVVVFRGLKAECAACHKDPHKGALGTTCATCHGTETFRAKGFRHPRFPELFAGAHEDLACEKCHGGPKSGPNGRPVPVSERTYRGLSTACASCHKDPHLGQVSSSCESCHAVSGAKVQAFKHSGPPEFWKGRHAQVPCAACHKTVEAAFPAGKGTAVRYRGFPASCASCHKDPHRGALGASCQSCHTPSAPWKTASRAFHKTSWPLEGKHLLVPCASCHVRGRTKGTPRACADCHWYRRQDDRFKTALGLDCQSCHRPFSWTAVTWSHAAATGFALSGAHAALDCEKCHTGGVFRKGESGCVGCHQADYQKAANPNHAAAGFPTACETCHKAADASWKQGRFDHASAFVLSGKHATAACASCHGNGVYRGTPRDCASCHLSKYQATTNPNHAAAGFPTTCETCHKASDTSWNQGTFNHGTVFALQGRHATAACASCHKNGVYRGTPRDCASCHLSKYQATTNPNHAAAGFPTTCETCHRASDTSWNQGTFNHTWFPITTGRHAGNPCSACHTSPTNYAVFTCLTCHGRADTDKKHQGRAGYRYDSAACYSCHPQGRGD